MHRDLKPENILLDEDGHVLLLLLSFSLSHCLCACVCICAFVCVNIADCNPSMKKCLADSYPLLN